MSSQVLQAQVKFTASVSPASVGKNETFQLRLLVENALQVEQIRPPSFKNFIVVGGPNKESGMENINGVVRRYLGISFFLQPRIKGNLTIGPAIAKADGKILQSNPVKLLVTNADNNNNQNNSSPFAGLPGFDRPVASAPYKDYILKKGENIQEKISKNIFIKVTTDKKTCYVGQPIIVTYKLYTRLKSESNITKNPSFNGFSVIDLVQPGNTDYTIEKLDGREYNVYTLRKAQLYPLQEGDIELESAAVDNTIRFIKEEYANNLRDDAFSDVFRDFVQTTIPAEGVETQRVSLQSEAMMIHVKALPEANKPAFFKGAVGVFTIDASVEKNNFTTDDAGKLRVTISGEGNMHLVNAPEIAWPAGIEGFDPKITEQIDKRQVPLRGIKNYEFPFVVSKEGTYTLPPISFSFFDPASGKYLVLQTRALPLSITKGMGKPAAALVDTIPKTSKEKFFDKLFNNRLMIVIPIALIIITGLFFWLRRDTKKQSAKTAIATNKETVPVISTIEIPEDPFLRSREKLLQQEHHGFYETLNQELRQLLANRLSIPLTEINKKRIAEETDKNGVAVSTSVAVQQLMDDIEWQLYTPFTEQDAMQDLYERAESLVHLLPKKNA